MALASVSGACVCVVCREVWHLEEPEELKKIVSSLAVRFHHQLGNDGEHDHHQDLHHDSQQLDQAKAQPHLQEPHQ